ncbi:hypothetical protein D3C85_1168220 [compost metagenome]
MAEDIEEARQQGAAHHPGADAVQGMDEAIADDPDRRGTQGTDHDSRRQRHRLGHAVNGLASQDDVGNKETDINQRGKKHDQQRAKTPELATALHHLRNAHARPLGRCQGNDDAANHVP